MFTGLNLQNFQCWKSADLTFSRITGLYGKNSYGKTSLLQFPLLLKQTMVSTNRNCTLSFNGPYLNLGSISDAIYRHDTSLNLNYNISLQLQEALSLYDHSSTNREPFETSNELSISSKIRIEDHVPFCHSLEYCLGKFCFSVAELSNGKARFKLDSNRKSEFTFVRNQGRSISLPGPIKSCQFPDQARLYYNNSSFLSDLDFAFECQLNRLHYLGPLRLETPRDYFWSYTMPSDIGKYGERTIDALIASQESGTRLCFKKGGRKYPFTKVVALRLRSMGLLYDLRVSEIKKGSNLWQVWIKTSKNGSEVLLPDAGFGVSQVLPVVTLLYFAPEGSTVVLEQPEIHLHPLAQAELADLIVATAMHRNVQIIYESHSENFLLRLQRRIAEEVLPSENVKLYFCETSNDGSNLMELQLDTLGNITNWPWHFMGDAFGETGEAELARIRKRKIE